MLEIWILETLTFHFTLCEFYWVCKKLQKLQLILEVVYFWYLYISLLARSHPLIQIYCPSSMGILAQECSFILRLQLWWRSGDKGFIWNRLNQCIFWTKWFYPLLHCHCTISWGKWTSGSSWFYKLLLSKVLGAKSKKKMKENGGKAPEVGLRLKQSNKYIIIIIIKSPTQYPLTLACQFFN